MPPRKKKIIADKDQTLHPNERQKQWRSMRILDDERIEDIMREIYNIKIEIMKLKSQISAHDYNIIKEIRK